MRGLKKDWRISLIAIILLAVILALICFTSTAHDEFEPSEAVTFAEETLGSTGVQQKGT